MNWSAYTLLLPLIPGRREATEKITARFPGILVEPGPELALLGQTALAAEAEALWAETEI